MYNRNLFLTCFIVVVLMLTHIVDIAYCNDAITTHTTSSKILDTFTVDLKDVTLTLEKELETQKNNDGIKYALSLMYIENGSYSIDSEAVNMQGDPTKLEKAETLLKELTTKNEYKSMANYYLGICILQKKVDEKNISKASEYFSLAIANNSNNYQAYRKLYILYLMQKNYLGSIELLLRAKNIFPNEPDIYHKLSLSYMFTKNYAKCIEYAKKALLLRDNVDTKLSLASAYSATENYSLARDVLEDILRVDPKNKSALLGISVVLAKSGNKDAAIEYLNKAMRYFPDDAEVQSTFNRLQKTQ